MLIPLAVLFLVVPFLELALILQAGRSFGVWWTIAVLVLISLLGAYLVRREGFAVLRRGLDRFHGGQLPGNEIVDGVLILFAGALLLTPGFITDFLGVVLLIPPSRAVIRRLVVRYLAARLRRSNR